MSKPYCPVCGHLMILDRESLDWVCANDSCDTWIDYVNSEYCINGVDWKPYPAHCLLILNERKTE